MMVTHDNTLAAMTEQLSIRDRLIWWEVLRIPYNVAMLLAGVFVAFSVYNNVNDLPQFFAGKLLFRYSPMCVVGMSVAFAIAANIAYPLGPAVEVYAVTFTRLHFGSGLRLFLFIMGLLFSSSVQGVVWLDYALID